MSDNNNEIDPAVQIATAIEREAMTEMQVVYLSERVVALRVRINELEQQLSALEAKGCAKEDCNG